MTVYCPHYFTINFLAFILAIITKILLQFCCWKQMFKLWYFLEYSLSVSLSLSKVDCHSQGWICKPWFLVSIIFFPECEQEVEWLKEAGYDELVKKFRGKTKNLWWANPRQKIIITGLGFGISLLDNGDQNFGKFYWWGKKVPNGK